MNRSLTVAAAVLRKDLIALWPLALFTAVMIALRQFFADVQADLIQAFMPLLSYLCCVFLVIAVVQQDATASLRHDWLTRPIARRDLLLAKTAFLIAAIFLPLMAGEIVHGMIGGQAFAEAFARSIRLDKITVIAFVLVFTVATVSGSVLEAAGGAIGLGVASLILISGVLIFGLGEGGFFTGSGWVIVVFFYVATAALVAAVLWLQYARRNTGGARLAFAGGALAMAFAGAFLPWSVVFAVQKAFSAEPARADAFVLRMPPDCFRTVVIEAGEGVGPQYTDPNYTAATALTRWDEEQRAAVGPHAISFLTEVRAEGVPRDWRPMVGRVRATFVNTAGDVVVALEPGRQTAIWSVADDGVPVAIHGWLMSRGQYDLLSKQTVSLRLDYSISLLRPEASFEFPADGTRHAVPGVGYCGTEPSTRSRIALNCFINKMQPAVVAAAVVGAPGDGITMESPDYRPAALGFLTDANYAGGFAVDGERIRVTPFTARAHFDRHIETAGILGGASCPPPV